MTTLARPPPASFKARTEFSITLDVPKVKATSEAAPVVYRFEYRELGSSWETAQRLESKRGDDEIVLDDLNPTSTYEIRIFAVARDATGNETVSAPSDVAAVDTDVPGCVSEPKCVML